MCLLRRNRDMIPICDRQAALAAALCRFLNVAMTVVEIGDASV
jgi:hypothetical protein